MYKLVIADDEPIIRKSIAKVIEWNELGFELVGVFGDGSAVIEFIKENEVDVILSDIIMGDVSGIDIAKFIYNQKLPIKIILLSAYQNFEFAREGIKFQVFDYLLKPVGIDEITNKFTELKKILDEEKELISNSEDNHEFINKIHDSFIKRLWFANNVVDEEFFVYNNVINIPEKSRKRSVVFMCKAMTGSGLLDERLISVKDKLAQKGFYTCYIGDGSALVFFTENELSDINVSINKAIKIISCEEISVFFVNLKQYVCSDEKKLPSQTVKNMKEAIKEAVDFLEKLDCCQQNEDEKLESLFLSLPDDNRQAVINVSVEVFLNIISISMMESKQMYAILKRTIFEGGRISIHFQKVYNQFLKMHNTGFGDEYDYAIEKVKCYIKSHISEDISLNQLASLVNLNPAYFGRYFKKSTLLTVKNFIYETKMENAIVLLSEKKYTVNEIAQMIGCDFKYFFLLFKKYTGYTPKEYLKYFIE